MDGEPKNQYCMLEIKCKPQVQIIYVVLDFLLAALK